MPPGNQAHSLVAGEPTCYSYWSQRAITRESMLHNKWSHVIQPRSLVPQWRPNQPNKLKKLRRSYGKREGEKKCSDVIWRCKGFHAKEDLTLEMSGDLRLILLFLCNGNMGNLMDLSKPQCLLSKNAFNVTYLAVLIWRLGKITQSKIHQNCKAAAEVVAILLLLWFVYTLSIFLKQGCVLTSSVKYLQESIWELKVGSDIPIWKRLSRRFWCAALVKNRKVYTLLSSLRRAGSECVITAMN